jgi:hypothetical protein
LCGIVVACPHDLIFEKCKKAMERFEITKRQNDTAQGI